MLQQSTFRCKIFSVSSRRWHFIRRQFRESMGTHVHFRSTKFYTFAEMGIDTCNVMVVGKFFH